MEANEQKDVEVLGGRLDSLNLEEGATSEQKVQCDGAGSDNDGDKMVELKARFNSLIIKAKNNSKDGDFEESLRFYKKAYKINKSEKVLKRIEKLESLLQESNSYYDDSTVGTGYVDVADGFKLSENVYNKLYPYQKEGVVWFWELFQDEKGGILGDDMGLGKTIQVISFLSGMFDQDYIKTVLIIMPVSLLTNWNKEFKKWAPEIRVCNFHGSNQKQRADNLAKIQSRNGICLTTYGLANTCQSMFSQDSNGREFIWDYVILDEGHKIKNTANKTTKSICRIPAYNRFILTGTPIQNNLREMWALFDYVCEGKLLGTSRSFKQEYENPIVRARERDATAYEKRIGQEMSTHLREMIAPHFLRRTKAILEDRPKTSEDQNDGVPSNDEMADEEESGRSEVACKAAKLTRKNDFIIWVYLSEAQLQIYKDFLELDRVKQILMTTRSPLAELNVLKKVCDHPRLLSTMACQQLGLSDEQDDDDDYDTSAEWCAPPVEQLIQESGKMTFLVELLQKLKQDGHRVLVFSQSTKMLDIIQKVLKEKSFKTIRIDGSVSKIEERERRIDAFQTDPSYTVFLLTTQVGGVGLTLTAADRVVIFDPSWNPATDAQATDRVYRIGQTKTVVIYRLITCGSLEEKIYRKQVFKQAITKQTTGSSNNPYRYFTRHDLRDLFVLDDPKSSKTQIQLEKMHSSGRCSDTKLDEHVAFLYSTDIFGISDHDLLFSQEAVSTQEELHAASEMGEVIQAKVRRAADIMKAESSLAPGRRGPHPVDPQRSAVPKKKNQTKMSDHLEPFIPSQEDSTRFMKKKIQPSPPPTDGIDITLMDNEIDEDELGEQLSAITIKDNAVPSVLATRDLITIEDSDDDDDRRSEPDVQEKDRLGKMKMLSADEDYGEGTSEDSTNGMQASAGKDVLVQINTIDEDHHEKRLSEGKKQSNGSMENQDTADSDAEEERDPMYRSNDLDTSQESSQDDGHNCESDDERSRKSGRNRKVTSGSLSNDDEIFVGTNEQKKVLSEENYDIPEGIVSDEELFDAKSVSEDALMESEEENGNIGDSGDDEDVVEDYKVEDTVEEFEDSADGEVVDGEYGIVRDSADEEVVDGDDGIVRDSADEEVVDGEDSIVREVRDSADEGVVDGEDGIVKDSEDEEVVDSEDGIVRDSEEVGDGEDGIARESEDERIGDSDDNSDEDETNRSDEMKTSDSEDSEGEVKSNDSVDSQASDDDTEAIVPTKTTGKARRQILSDDESEEDDTGEEDIPVNSSPEKFEEQAREPEEVVQPTAGHVSKTTCSPRGKHVSHLFDVMPSEAQEAYKMHVNTARDYEKSKALIVIEDSADEDYGEGTSEDSTNGMQASAGEDVLVQINTIDENHHEKRLSEGKKQSNGSMENQDDTTDSDAEEERANILRPISASAQSPDGTDVSRDGGENESIYRSLRSNDLDTSQESSQDDGHNFESDDERSRKSERNKKVTSGSLSDDDEIFVGTNEQKKVLSEENHDIPEGIVSDDEEEFFDAKSVSEDVLMESEEENGHIRDSGDDEDVVEVDKVEDTVEEIEDSADEEVVDGEDGIARESEDERIGDSEDEETSDDNSDEDETNRSDEMKTSEMQSSNAEHSESELKSNDSVDSQASDDDTEAIVPTKTTGKGRRKIVSDDESEEDDTGKENIPLNSSPEKFEEQARKPEEVVQPTAGHVSKTTCCPRGKHVSDLFDIHSCPCVMSSEAQEAYKMHVNTARGYEKSKQLKLSLKHFAEAYKLCDSDERLRYKINQVYKAVKPLQ